MVSKEYPRIGEKIYHAELPNGLHIYVDRRPEFQKSYAFFATNYGGMDMKFRLDGQWRDTPAGVAHFLEHKMFDTEDGNALQDLAANGASPNAFTSSALTGYYFESTEKFCDNLKILLSFVSIPWFTQESVDKEQGIIGQEIRMVEDDPDNQVFYGLMECLFDHHPIRVPIAGTQESISHITADTLYACHKAFYTPSNMVLTVAGDVEPEEVVRIAREILPKEPGGHIERDYGGEEDGAAAKPEKELRMEVSTPIFQLGFKAEPAPAGEEHLRRQLMGELACEALLGNSSPLYARLYSEGLINKNFGYGFELYPGCALMAAGGESCDPRAVRDAVLAAGPNSCPPMVVGVGLGGTMEVAALCAKRAAARDLESRNPDPRYAAFEDELLELINRTGIGPQGLGGETTALKVHVEWAPTHIASLPVAVNINCHAARHAEVRL